MICQSTQCPGTDQNNPIPCHTCNTKFHLSCADIIESPKKIFVSKNIVFICNACLTSTQSPKRKQNLAQSTLNFSGGDFALTKSVSSPSLADSARKSKRLCSEEIKELMEAIKSMKLHVSKNTTTLTELKGCIGDMNGSIKTNNDELSLLKTTVERSPSTFANVVAQKIVTHNPTNLSTSNSISNGQISSNQLATPLAGLLGGPSSINRPLELDAKTKLAIKNRKIEAGNNKIPNHGLGSAVKLTSSTPNTVRPPKTVLQRSIYVSRLETTVKAENLIEFIKTQIPSLDMKHVSAHPLLPKNKDLTELTFISFRLRCTEDLFTTLRARDFWPEHVFIGDFLDQPKILISGDSISDTTTTSTANASPQRQIPKHPPQPVLNVPTQISGKIAEFISAVKPEGAPFINPTDIISQTNALEAKEFIQQQLKKPLGPDHINTLEQLKIELENITHVHMMNKLLAENETAQLSPEMMDNQLSEEDQGNMVNFIQDIGDNSQEPMQEPFVNQNIPMDMYGNNMPAEKYINSSHTIQAQHQDYSASESIPTSTITSPPEFNQQMVNSPTLELQPLDLISALQPTQQANQQMIHSMTSQHSSSVVSTPTGECMPHPFQNLDQEAANIIQVQQQSNALTYSDAVKLPIQETVDNMQHPSGQHMMTNTVIGYQPDGTQNLSTTNMEAMTAPNENQVVVRNEAERPREPEVTHVRKISRFQVSHVKEGEETVKIPNIVHGSEILLENVSPEQQPQQQQQVHHEYVTHNIQVPIDTSPDKIDQMQHHQMHDKEHELQQDLHPVQNQAHPMTGQIQTPNEIPMQSPMQHDQTAMQTQNYVQNPTQPQSQPQPHKPQMQQPPVNYATLEQQQVMNQQIVQTSMSQPVPMPVPIPVTNIPPQIMSTPSGPQQPAIVSQQQINFSQNQNQSHSIQSNIDTTVNMMGTTGHQPVSQPQVLPIEKPLFTQTLKAPVSQSSTVCTPSEMMTTPIPQNEKTEIKQNLEVTRNMLSTMRLEPTSRQRLQLLLQRQHIEEEELRLRHFMELEKFREQITSDDQKNN